MSNQAVPGPERRLRVAHLLVHGEMDGIGLHVLDLAAAQMEEGRVDPVLFTTPSPGYSAALARAGVPMVAGGRARFGSALATYVRRDLSDLDLVHVHGYRATHLLPALGLLGGTHWRVPVVGTCHLLARGTFRRSQRSWMELRCYGLLDLLITSSDEQAIRARAAHPALEVRYVPNGVEMPEPDPGAGDALCRRFGFPAGSRVVASIGRLHPQKRPDLFLEACLLIAQDRPEVRFLAVGDGPDRAILEKQAREIGLDVVFTGFVDEVPEICAGIALLLHTADNEGTPRAVLHAMAAGCAVVATAAGGVPDLIDDGVEGFVVPCGDAAAVAGQALWLLDRPEERLEMGRRARKRVEAEFSIEVMQKQVEEAYRYALRTMRRPPPNR